MSDQTCRSNCPIAFALDLFGDRWSLLVLRDLLFLGKRRFSEFLGSPEGIATNILADRLRRLEEAGLLRRAADPDDGRKAIYSATEASLGLLPALIELMLWGHAQQPAGTSGAPAEFVARVRTDRAGLERDLRALHHG